MVASAWVAFALAKAQVHHPFVIAAFLAGVLILAYVVSARFTRPLRALADAARRLGLNIESAGLPETGPAEVREAAIAFNGMQRRIRADVLERTSMVAAITHDLQTPLTRLRLRLEKVPDEALRAKLLEDLALMREMVREGLDFASSFDGNEPEGRVDLDALLSSIVDDARDAGENVTLDGATGAVVVGGVNALRRCVGNLVDNAISYGSSARVTLTATTSGVRIQVSDDGPGIPTEHLERVFEPFYRIDPSRSRETGGTGLGLAIARNIARRYRGDVTVANRAGGGLDATIVFPTA